MLTTIKQLPVFFTFSASFLRIYLFCMCVSLRSVFRSWSLLSRSFQISLRHITLGTILGTSDQTLRPLPANHKIHKIQTSMSSVQFQPQSQKAKVADTRLSPPEKRYRLLNNILILSRNSQHLHVTGGT